MSTISLMTHIYMQTVGSWGQFITLGGELGAVRHPGRRAGGRGGAVHHPGRRTGGSSSPWEESWGQFITLGGELGAVHHPGRRAGGRGGAVHHPRRRAGGSLSPWEGGVGERKGGERRGGQFITLGGGLRAVYHLGGGRKGGGGTGYHPGRSAGAHGDTVNRRKEERDNKSHVEGRNEPVKHLSTLPTGP